MQTEFKTGDCVELKYSGGGIQMVIDQLFTYQGEDRSICKWYNKAISKFDKEAFSLNALKKCGET
jgi:uncharacterized protein YodC (DUF2158 family)